MPTKIAGHKNCRSDEVQDYAIVMHQTVVNEFLSVKELMSFQAKEIVSDSSLPSPFVAFALLH